MTIATSADFQIRKTDESCLNQQERFSRNRHISRPISRYIKLVYNKSQAHPKYDCFKKSSSFIKHCEKPYCFKNTTRNNGSGRICLL